MADPAAADPDERDWRLEGVLQGEAGEAHRGALRSLVGRMRGPDPVQDAEKAVAEDVVVTHDGARLFAYAAGREAIERARTAIEAALERDGASASLTLTCWDPEREEWRDPDAPAPPPAALEAEAEPVTRTYVATLGKWVREEFEQSMRDAAGRLGLSCEIVEHPHLLSTQAAFTVTGPARRVDEFERGMRAEERATIRTETVVMTSPL